MARSPSVRVAYFVQTHRPGDQVHRLLSTLRRGSPAAVLLVGHDPSVEALDERTLTAYAALCFRPAEKPRRGYWSMLAPFVEAVERLDREGIAYDWLVYLSGQDYPVQPLARGEALLAASPFDGYLTWADAAAPSAEGRRWQGRRRYLYQYRDVAWPRPLLAAVHALNGVQSRWHLHLTYGPRFGRPAAASPFGPALRPFWGSQWTSLRRICAERVAEAARGEPDLVAYFARTVCPDEAFAQTVLVNDGRFRLCNDNLRFVDQRGARDGRPRVLRRADGPALVGGAYAFARKFDSAVDSAILEWLDERLGG